MLLQSRLRALRALRRLVRSAFLAFSKSFSSPSHAKSYTFLPGIGRLFITFMNAPPIESACLSWKSFSAQVNNSSITSCPTRFKTFSIICTFFSPNLVLHHFAFCSGFPCHPCGGPSALIALVKVFMIIINNRIVF